MNSTVAAGTAVKTWDGLYGVVLYVNGDWYGVLVDGEHAAHEWQRHQLTRVIDAECVEMRS